MLFAFSFCLVCLLWLSTRDVRLCKKFLVLLNEHQTPCHFWIHCTSLVSNSVSYDLMKHQIAPA